MEIKQAEMLREGAKGLKSKAGEAEKPGLPPQEAARRAADAAYRAQRKEKQKKPAEEPASSGTGI